MATIRSTYVTFSGNAVWQVGARSAENQLHQKGSLQPQALRIPWSAVFARALADCSSSQRSNNSWRLSQEALATQTKRKPEREATCQVCDREDDHAVVRCPQAAVMRCVNTGCYQRKTCSRIRVPNGCYTCWAR